MESAAFRKWLAEQGCRFDRHERQQRGQGHVVLTVHREGRKAEIPLGGSRQTLDVRVVRRACEELGLDWSLSDRKDWPSWSNIRLTHSTSTCRSLRARSQKWAA